MINLMPIGIRKDREYGRKNAVLLKWLIQSATAMLLLLLFIIIGFGIMDKAQTAADSNKNAVSTSMSDEKLDETKKAYAEFSSNLKTVTQILSKQVIYSSLIKQIGSVTPPGASLNTISIASSDNALDLNFTIKSSDIAPVLQLNLQDIKNKLFEKADIIQVNCTQADDSTSKCSAQLRAAYRKDAAFLFINTLGASK